MQYLFRPDGRLAVDANLRPRLGTGGDPCCCGDAACAGFIRAVWCCDPTRVAWLWMNRPECAGYQPDQPSIPATGSVTVALSGVGAVNNCWSTDPNEIRASRDIPSNEPILFGSPMTIADGCQDPICGPCPECCGSRLMPTGCGGGLSTSERVCCECGDDYTLTITETSRSSAVATHYADPCVVFPSIGAGPSWDVTVTRTATFHFGCEEIEENGKRVLRRKVTGQSVMRRIDREHYALIRYVVPTSSQDPTQCALLSFSAGHRTVTTEREFVRTWEELGGGEGCGLTREAVAQTTPHDLGLDRATLGSGAFQAASRFDLFGECTGALSQALSACGEPPGGLGPGSNACGFGLGTVGWNVQWGGNKACGGGSYSESGTATVVTNVRADTIVNDQPPGETLWLGAEAVEWQYDVAWQVSGGRECFADPCGQQGGETGSKAGLRMAMRGMGSGKVQGKSGTLTRDALLNWAASKVGGCGGCGTT